MEKVEMNKEMKLSEHFKLGELCKTNHKTSDGNIPSRVAIENLRNICENWLEDLRYSYNTLYHEISPCASCVPLVASEQSSSALSRDDKSGDVTQNPPPPILSQITTTVATTATRTCQISWNQLFFTVSLLSRRQAAPQQSKASFDCIRFALSLHQR